MHDWSWLCMYIRVTCCCRWQRYRVDKTRISTWVHHSGDGTNRATKPQMGSEFPWKWRVDIWLLDAVSTQLYLAMPVCQKNIFLNLPTALWILRILMLGASTRGWEPARRGSDKCKVHSHLQPHLTWQCPLEKYSAISVITHIGKIG